MRLPITLMALCFWMVSILACYGAERQDRKAQGSKVTEVRWRFGSPHDGSEKEVVLYPDGTATLHGYGAAVGRPGQPNIVLSKGRFSLERFDRLVELLQAQDFFGLNSVYGKPSYPLQHSTISVVKDGKQKTVQRWPFSSVDESAPLELWSIDMAVRGVASEIRWGPVTELRSSSNIAVPAWFAQKEARGLNQTPTGQPVWKPEGSGYWQALPPIPAVGSLFGAAYYPESRALLVVTNEGVVIYYEGQSGSFKEMKRFTPDYQASTRSVRFTRVPGLVYLLAVDIKKEKELKGTPAQQYPDRYYRVTLTDAAQEWHGVPVVDSEEKLLGGCYTGSNQQLELSRAQGSWVSMRLPEALASPFRSGPFDDLAQSVFVFPDKGIVCRTVKGWSLHRMDGRLIRWFPTQGISAAWWSDPTLKQGVFFVHARTGPGGDTYRMDVESGKLIKMNRQP